MPFLSVEHMLIILQYFVSLIATWSMTAAEGKKEADIFEVNLRR